MQNILYQKQKIFKILLTNLKKYRNFLLCAKRKTN